MSFCNNPNQATVPGPISGNPLHNLCERACVQVKKVFDACLSQITLENYTLTLTNPTPSTYVTPLTFVSGASTSAVGEITAQTITPIADKPGYSRVQATINIPVEVAYVDSDSKDGVAEGTITVSEDVVLCVPSNSVIPVDLATTVNAVITTGTNTSDLTFSVTACVTVVLKVEAEVELLIPAYGYCQIPACQPFTETACSGVFDMPLFPQAVRTPPTR